jgi:hypothetical protein
VLSVGFWRLLLWWRRRKVAKSVAVNCLRVEVTLTLAFHMSEQPELGSVPETVTRGRSDGIRGWVLAKWGNLGRSEACSRDEDEF